MLSFTPVKPPQLDEFFSAGEAGLRADEFAELGWTEDTVVATNGNGGGSLTLPLAVTRGESEHVTDSPGSRRNRALYDKPANGFL